VAERGLQLLDLDLMANGEEMVLVTVTAGFSGDLLNLELTEGFGYSGPTEVAALVFRSDLEVLGVFADDEIDQSVAVRDAAETVAAAVDGAEDAAVNVDNEIAVDQFETAIVAVAAEEGVQDADNETAAAQSEADAQVVVVVAAVAEVEHGAADNETVFVLIVAADVHVAAENEAVAAQSVADVESAHVAAAAHVAVDNETVSVPTASAARFAAVAAHVDAENAVVAAQLAADVESVQFVVAAENETEEDDAAAQLAAAVEAKPVQLHPHSPSQHFDATTNYPKTTSPHVHFHYSPQFQPLHAPTSEPLYHHHHHPHSLNRAGKRAPFSAPPSSPPPPVAAETALFQRVPAASNSPLYSHPFHLGEPPLKASAQTASLSCHSPLDFPSGPSPVAAPKSQRAPY
jgi:hypothetical protein